jgi:hypothetical protein
VRIEAENDRIGAHLNQLKLRNARLVTTAQKTKARRGSEPCNPTMTPPERNDPGRKLFAFDGT